MGVTVNHGVGCFLLAIFDILFSSSFTFTHRVYFEVLNVQLISVASVTRRKFNKHSANVVEQLSSKF